MSIAGHGLLTRESNNDSQNKALLGICLGAQIIGESLGVRTERNY